MAIFRRSGDRLSDTIVLLIAWLRTHPADHRITLRSQICLYIVMFRRVIERELSKLFKYPDTAGSLTRKDITECHIMTAYPEFDLYGPSLRITESTYGLCSFIVHFRSLAAVQPVAAADLGCFHADKLEL